jgi:hypothetical protein
MRRRQGSGLRMFSCFKPPAVALAVATVLVCAGSASAAGVVWSDNFNRSVNNTVGNGWSEIERNADDVAIINLGDPHNGVLQLRDYLSSCTNTACASSAADAQVYKTQITLPKNENVFVAFDYKGHNTESPDKFYFEWKSSTSSTWNQVPVGGITPGDQNWHLNYTILLGNFGNTTTKIDIRFWTDVTDSSYGTDEAFKIDNFSIYSVVPPPAAPSATPIPGSLPLFLSGVGLIGGLLCRRKCKAQKAAELNAAV